MKKHILIITPNFKIGGTNTSLNNLLSLIDTNKYKVSVFVMNHCGVHFNTFTNCSYLKRNIFIDAIMSQTKEHDHFWERIFVYCFKVLNSIGRVIGFDLSNYIFKKVANKISKIGFDSVIAFQEGGATRFGSHFSCRNKIAWIHCDYSSYLNMIGNRSEEEIYKEFNSIVCVSEYTKSVFLNHFPSFTEKIYAIHNILNYKNILNLSKKIDELDVKFDNKLFTIVSVGRLDSIKRFSLIPKISHKLLMENLKFRWYIIGGGFEKEQLILQKQITKYNVNDTVIFLGEKKNPYPYIANSDLYVCTSISEACPYVLNEAKILHTPIVTTNFGSATEFIENGKTGYVSSIENIVDEIKQMIDDKDRYNNIKNNLNHFVYDNQSVLNRIYTILK